MRGASVIGLTACAIAACSETTAPRAAGTTGDGNTRSVPAPGMSFGAVTLDRYCESRAELECHRLQVCGPTILASAHGDAAACVREKTAVCEGAFTERTAALIVEKGLVTYDAAAMGAALSEHSRRHCNTRAPAPSPAVATRGALADGTRCIDHDVCASGWCEGLQPFRCGTCGPRPASAPSTCPAACPLHERCKCQGGGDAGPRQCGCTPALAEGADCKAERSGCDEGLGCLDVLDGSGNTKTICRSLPVDGERCGVGAGFVECVGEATCQPGADGKSACKKPELSSPGVQCDEPRRLCPMGYDCRGSCVPHAGRGERCISRAARTVPDGGPPTCAEGFCSGNCLEPGGRGSGCVDALDCRDETGCYLFGVGSGACEVWDNVRTRTEQEFTCR